MSKNTRPRARGLPGCARRLGFQAHQTRRKRAGQTNARLWHVHPARRCCSRRRHPAHPAAPEPEHPAVQELLPGCAKSPRTARSGPHRPGLHDPPQRCGGLSDRGHRGDLRPAGKNGARRTAQPVRRHARSASASNGAIPPAAGRPPPTAPRRKPRTRSPAATAPRSNSPNAGSAPRTATGSFVHHPRPVVFDASQYEFERQIKLTDYVNLRDEAFASFRKAAELYAAKLPDLPRGQWTDRSLSRHGFSSCSVPATSPSSPPTRPQPTPGSNPSAMPCAPCPARRRTNTWKCSQNARRVVSARSAQCPPALPPLRIEDHRRNHPAAAAATKSLDYYRELLDEIQLRVTVDGPPGSATPSPSACSSAWKPPASCCARAAASANTCRARASNQQAMMGGGGGPTHLRDDFTKNIHAALDETFEVFPSPSTTPRQNHRPAARGLGRNAAGLCRAARQKRRRGPHPVDPARHGFHRPTRAGRAAGHVPGPAGRCQDATVENRPCAELSSA
jgi:hypothetical protein